MSTGKQHSTNISVMAGLPRGRGRPGGYALLPGLPSGSGVAAGAPVVCGDCTQWRDDLDVETSWDINCQLQIQNATM